MIEQIRLQNFQAHKDTTLELHPKINVIVGESDQGKSSIARALYWLFFNRPSGDEFVNSPKKKTEVTAICKGKEITRVRSKSINKYVINGADFDAPRTDVPDQIRDIINFTPTNIQLQDDSPFLLHLNSGDVAKKLNNVVGLNLIDSSYSYINSVIKKQSAQEKQLKKEIQEKKKQLQSFAKLDTIIEKSEKFEQLQEKLITLDKKHADLSSTIDKIEQTREVLVLQKKIESTSNPLRSLQKALDSLKEQKQKTERILKYTRLLMELQTKINKQTKPQKRIKQMTEELTQQIQVLEDKKRKTKAIQKIAKVLKESGDQFDTVSKSTAKAQKEFERYKAKLKICPLCDSKLN